MQTKDNFGVSTLRVTFNAADVAVIIPTYNAEKHWWALRMGLDRQGVPSSQILVIDSSSTDATRELASEAGYRVIRIPKETFNHGGTRQLACSYMSDYSYLVFITQDVVMESSDSILKLCLPFENDEVGASYGRQLPKPNADPIERHGRMFNYPSISDTRELKSRKALGFRTVFFSDSFAAYRRSALSSVGGFPLDAIVSEEVTVAARMLLKGWKIVYAADSRVIHSHSLSLRAEFGRYFDIGIHHGREPWILQEFGGPRVDGLRFIKSELAFLLDRDPLWIPYAIIRVFSKYVAYKLGKNEKKLPRALIKKLSAQPAFWRTGELKLTPPDEI